MKILFVSAVLPWPLHSGGQVRIYNLLKRLSKKHEISLFAFIRDRKEEQYRNEFSFCKKIVTVMRGSGWQAKYVLKNVISSYPFLWTTYNNYSMRHAIRHEISKQQYDLVHIEPGYVWPSIPRIDVPMVIAEHNIEHEIYSEYIKGIPFLPLRLIVSIDVLKMKRWEKIIWKKAKHITAVSETDRFNISSIACGDNVTVVENGVDIINFSYKPKKTIDKKSPVFLYVGNFSWIQNSDAIKYLLKEIWGKIQKQYPGATLRIIGKNASPQLRELFDHSITLVESVDRIQDEYHNADILLAPIRVGGGTKYKILESMACGLPVITTNVGAMGLQGRHKKEILIADTIDEILSAIEYIVSGSTRLQITQSARALVEKEYSWTHIVEKLDEVWRKIYEEHH